MTSCMRSTPTAGLEAALGIPPLYLYAQRQALNAVPRLFRAGRWGTTTPPLHTHRHLLWSEYDTFAPDAGTIEPKGFKVNRILLNRPPHDAPEFSVYTDGSKNPGNTGHGWCVTQDNYVHEEISSPLDANSSIYMAEVMALISVTNHLLEPEYYNKKINIWSDSLSTINALAGAISTNPLLLDLMENLVLLERRTRLTLN